MSGKNRPPPLGTILGEPEEIRRLVAELAELAVQERRYREMVESVNSIIVVWGKDLKIEFINPFGAKFFGYRKEELEGGSLIGTIVAGSDSAGHDMQVMMNDIVARPETFRNHENENVTRDGRKVWIAWTNQSVLNEEGRVSGILSVGNDITEQKKYQNELKTALSVNESLLREMEEMNRRLDLLAHTDQLTSLLNRRSGMERLTEEFFRAKRHGFPLGLLMIDIDHFKKINDTHGHATGDLALKTVAHLISENVRQEDSVYRFGGEEICVILPYASTARCWNAGARLRKAVDEGMAAGQASGELPCRATISVGGASTEQGIESEEELLKAADRMMYVSKESGRNRVTIAGLNEKS